MAYRCDQAVIGGVNDAILCKVSGTVCAHQKFCTMAGRTVLTDEALRCPARDGQMPEAVLEKPELKPEKKAQRTAAKPAAKQTAGKTAARKK